MRRVSKVVGAVMRFTERARMSEEERWRKETDERCEETGWEVFILSVVSSATRRMCCVYLFNCMVNFSIKARTFCPRICRAGEVNLEFGM